MTVRASVNVSWDADDEADAIATVEGWTLHDGGEVQLQIEEPQPMIVQRVVGAGTADADGTVDLTVPGRALYSISPPTGPEAGGTTITLTGRGLTNIGGVRFEGTTTAWADSFDVVDDQTITCPTPPGTGTVDVVAFDGDPGDAVLRDGFTYTT